MRDDGINYLQDLLIVPPEDIERVAAELAAVAACQDWDATNAMTQVLADRADSVCDAHAFKSFAKL